MTRYAVLISGRGSNLRAIADAARAGDIDGELALVVSNRAEAPGLCHASDACVPAITLQHRDFGSRQAYDEALDAALREHEIELIVLAGFMRVLSPWLVSRWRHRILNIHPSLLPAFPGRDPQVQAIAAGAKYSGVTVHFVDEGIDTGPIIAQRPVPILEGDCAQSLAKRILTEEHALYPEIIDAVLAGRVSVDGRRVRVLSDPPAPGDE